MKVNIKLEISDELRNALACLIAGKEVKRLASREDVNEYVRGAVDALAPSTERDGATDPMPSAPCREAPLDHSEQRIAQKLRSEGKCDSYIRGYIKVGRTLRK